MHVTLYLAIMLTLSSIIAALSLLLMLLERRPRGRHTAMEHQPGLNQLSQGTRERELGSSLPSSGPSGAGGVRSGAGATAAARSSWAARH